MKNRPPLRCAHCGQLFQRKHGDGLFCSQAHADAHREINTRNDLVLRAAGFTVEGPLYTRDGHSLTLGEVKHVGLVTALTRHAAATAQE